MVISLGEEVSLCEDQIRERSTHPPVGVRASGRVFLHRREGLRRHLRRARHKTFL